MNPPNSVFLETNLISKEENRNFFFIDPREILEAYTLEQAEIILKKIEFYIEQGFYLAGYISYETGYLFEESFKKKWSDYKFNTPLIWFGVYESYHRKNPILNRSTTQKNFQIPLISEEYDQKSYEEKILKILEHIKNGETYQVNFTFKVNFEFEGEITSLYESLKSSQKVSYSAYIDDGKRKILSLSPELFFKRVKNKITTKPMKGTSHKGNSSLANRNILDQFLSDKKIKAENSMIVDLIRNDLGKISKIGSVKVEKLLAVEEYETLYQMTSTITAILSDKTNYFDLFKSLFPGGSVTGAPKYKTMQIIENMENSLRGIYTGAIGFISKDEAIFNIPIRTIEVEGKEGKMGIGSGIVWDSTPASEFEECLLKRRFFLHAIEFQLIESILLKNKTFYLLDSHLKRLEKSACYFGFAFDREKLIALLEKLKGEIFQKEKSSHFKIKILLSKNGIFTLEYSNILKLKKAEGRIKINSNKINSKNIFQHHKTSNRSLYDVEYAKAISNELVDYIFLNEKEEIVEGCIYNIFLKKNNHFYTPLLQTGALPGVMRNYLIKKGILHERNLTIQDLKSSDAIYLCNSVRGLIKVHLEDNLY